MDKVIFYLLSALTLLPAFFMLLSRNVLYCALMLLMSLLGVAGLFVLSMADFLAVAQIMVYIGGVLVLLLFGVMFTQAREGKALRTGIHNLTGGILSAGAFLGMALTAVKAVDWNNLPWIKEAGVPQVPASTIEGIGMGLMTHYILAFELVAVLLLVVLIGAAYISGRQSNSVITDY